MTGLKLDSCIRLARAAVLFSTEVLCGSNCFISWLDDVYQTLVSTNLILVTCIFIYVRRCQYCIAFFASRQRNRTADLSTSTFRRFNDFSRRLIDQLVIKRFQTNTNSLIWHRLSSNRKNKKIHPFSSTYFGKKGCA